jgi:nicotinamide mononucleotide (NMN) deamidase PncC
MGSAHDLDERHHKVTAATTSTGPLLAECLTLAAASSVLTQNQLVTFGAR